MRSSDFTKNGKPRNAGMFKSGVSGNPAGRPKKDFRVSQLAKQCTPAAIEALFEIALSAKTKDDDRIKAISIIFDRAYGKP